VPERFYCEVKKNGIGGTRASFGLVTYCLLISSSLVELTLHHHKSAPEGSLERESGYSGPLRAYSLENIAFGIRPAHLSAVK
jgi:hypothetical protein